MNNSIEFLLFDASKKKFKGINHEGDSGSFGDHLSFLRDNPEAAPDSLSLEVGSLIDVIKAQEEAGSNVYMVDPVGMRYITSVSPKPDVSNSEVTLQDAGDTASGETYALKKELLHHLVSFMDLHLKGEANDAATGLYKLMLANSDVHHDVNGETFVPVDIEVLSLLKALLELKLPSEAFAEIKGSDFNNLYKIN